MTEIIKASTCEVTQGIYWITDIVIGVLRHDIFKNNGNEKC